MTTRVEAPVRQRPRPRDGSESSGLEDRGSRKQGTPRLVVARETAFRPRTESGDGRSLRPQPWSGANRLRLSPEERRHGPALNIEHGVTLYETTPLGIQLQSRRRAAIGNFFHLTPNRTFGRRAPAGGSTTSRTVRPCLGPRSVRLQLRVRVAQLSARSYCTGRKSLVQLRDRIDRIRTSPRPATARRAGASRRTGPRSPLMRARGRGRSMRCRRRWGLRWSRRRTMPAARSR